MIQIYHDLNYLSLVQLMWRSTLELHQRSTRTQLTTTAVFFCGGVTGFGTLLIQIYHDLNYLSLVQLMWRSTLELHQRSTRTQLTTTAVFFCGGVTGFGTNWCCCQCCHIFWYWCSFCFRPVQKIKKKKKKG